jgi:predicted nucleotidyltransferase
MSGQDAAALLDRVVALSADDRRISAVLVFGSHATGTDDEFSDVDIGLVMSDAVATVEADVVALREEIAAGLGRSLLAMDFGDPANLHLIFADGVAAELILLRADELDLSRPHRVLLDKGDVVRRAEGPHGHEPARPDGQAVQELLLVFWHDLEHVIAALGRGQLLWAHGGLEEMRGVCVLLARLTAGAEFDAEDPYWKADAALGADLAARLRSTVVPAEAGPLRETAQRLVELYRDLASGVAAAYGFAYPSEVDALLAPRLDQQGIS